MKKIEQIVLLLFVFIISSSVWAQHIQQYTVNKINSEITIDGIMDENVWAEAEPTENFVILGDNQATPGSIAWAKILWDENFLYVAFYCQDSKVWATYDNRDDPLYKEDVVEVYIDPDGDGKKYLEIEVNPLNTIFDLWLTQPYSSGGQANVSWTMAGLETAVSIDGTINNNSDQDQAWVCEMAMPFSAMEFSAPSMNFPPLENDTWRFNLYRFDRSSTNNSVGEAMGWSQTSGSAHEPQNFGAIHFAGLGTGFDPSAKTIQGFILKQNHPNPFNPGTIIDFTIPEANNVKIAIYDSVGKEINLLLDEKMGAGRHSIHFDASNLSSGTYFYKLTSGDQVAIRKMLLLK